MTYARRQDANAAAVVKALREIGVQVHDLGRMAKFIPGFPDLLAVVLGRIHLIEVKTEKGGLTVDQVKFHGDWAGPPIVIVRSPEEAVTWASKERNKVFKKA